MRAIWKGHIRFSLVTIPIRMYSAIESSSSISFRQLHKEDNGRVGYQKVHEVSSALEIENAVRTEEMNSVRETIDVEGPFLWLAVFVQSIVLSSAYHHHPCNSRTIRGQFQFDDCYLPPMSSSILLTEASFLLSHNAATGYIHAGALSKEGIAWSYTKNQIGSVYQQLSDGARALDVMPKLLKNGTVICHHGAIGININFRDLLDQVVRWCQEKGSDQPFPL